MSSSRLFENPSIITYCVSLYRANDPTAILEKFPFGNKLNIMSDSSIFQLSEATKCSN